MKRSGELLKRLFLLALPMAALHAQSMKTGPEVRQEVPALGYKSWTMERVLTRPDEL